MKKKTIIQTIMFIFLAAGGLIAAAFTFDFFSGDTIPPGVSPDDHREIIREPNRVTVAKIRQIKDWHEAVGTFRPRIEARIGSQVMAQVLQIRVAPGDQVEKGDILAVLDNRSLESRLNQAREGLKSTVAVKNQARQAAAASKAVYAEAEAEYRRVKAYFESQAATEQQLEHARSVYLQAQAEVKRTRQGLKAADAQIEKAREAVREAQIALEYAELKAPETGEVLKRLAEPGDLALPGKPLIILQTAGTLRLEAYVREGLINQVAEGDSLPVEISALGTRTQSTVEEIVPYADVQSRTFLVKAAVPSMPGLFPGMFGKLLIPRRSRPAVLLAKEAVRRVGQLELVIVKTEHGWQKRFIKIGKAVDDKVEVLSGLAGNETVALGDF